MKNKNKVAVLRESFVDGFHGTVHLWELRRKRFIVSSCIYSELDKDFHMALFWCDKDCNITDWEPIYVKKSDTPPDHITALQQAGFTVEVELDAFK